MFAFIIHEYMFDVKRKNIKTLGETSARSAVCGNVNGKAVRSADSTVNRYLFFIALSFPRIVLTKVQMIFLR